MHLLISNGETLLIRRRGDKPSGEPLTHLVAHLVGTIDITYVGLGSGFIYLAIIMDVFTHSIRGWHLGRSLSQDLTLIALERGLVSHTPVIHHSDQGLQYAAPQYVEVLRGAGVQISMAAVGEPRHNGYAERVMRTIKE